MTEQIVDFFLDTTAQFNRHSVDINSKREIEQLLSSAHITASSTYARLEFKLSFLQDLAYLHGKLRQLQSFSLLFAHLAKLPPPHGRKLRRVITHLARFWQDVAATDAERIDTILLSIEQMVPSIWRWFNESVDHLADGTGCVRSTEPPRMHRGNLDVTLKRCKPDRIRCRIHKFFEENHGLFQDMKREIQSLAEGEKSKELRALEQIIASASADSRVLCDDRVCRRVGDALIGVDGKEFPAFVSSNSKEFGVICRVLGNTLVQIRPS